MKKVYYIWGPKYISGELNGPDLIAGVVLTEDKKLVFRGRTPQLMLPSMTIGEAEELKGLDAEKLFHVIVSTDVPESLQLVYDNADKKESEDFIRSLDASRD